MEGPLFDDARKALRFALNFEGGVPAPAMSRMVSLAASAPRKMGAARRRRFLKQYEHDPELRALAVELLDSRPAKARTPRSPRLPSGLDGAHLAGLVLAHLARLERHQQDLLVVRCRVPARRCACGSPCCGGWRRNSDWTEAFLRTCAHLAHAAEVVREPGRRGLSTRPEMRAAIVEQFFLDTPATLEELAGTGHCSVTTAARHRELIRDYLAQEENGAWAELAELFDQGGITGAFA